MLVLALLCSLGPSCAGKSPTGLLVGSRLEVFVHWGGQGVADRKLEIVELGLVRWTNGDGIARFSLPAGTYTLRAYVNTGGLPAPTDLSVTMHPGERKRVQVGDCLPCV